MPARTHRRDHQCGRACRGRRTASGHRVRRDARAGPRGFSGAPVVVRHARGPVVGGVITRMQEEDDDPERAVGGVVYAIRVGGVTDLWRPLARPVDPIVALAGTPGEAPFAGPV